MKDENKNKTVKIKNNIKLVKFPYNNMQMLTMYSTSKQYRENKRNNTTSNNIKNYKINFKKIPVKWKKIGMFKINKTPLVSDKNNNSKLNSKINYNKNISKNKKLKKQIKDIITIPQSIYNTALNNYLKNEEKKIHRARTENYKKRILKIENKIPNKKIKNIKKNNSYITITIHNGNPNEPLKIFRINDKKNKTTSKKTNRNYLLKRLKFKESEKMNYNMGNINEEKMHKSKSLSKLKNSYTFNHRGIYREFIEYSGKNIIRKYHAWSCCMKEDKNSKGCEKIFYRNYKVSINSSLFLY